MSIFRVRMPSVTSWRWDGVLDVVDCDFYPENKVCEEAREKLRNGTGNGVIILGYDDSRLFLKQRKLISTGNDIEYEIFNRYLNDPLRSWLLLIWDFTLRKFSKFPVNDYCWLDSVHGIQKLNRGDSGQGILFGRHETPEGFWSNSHNFKLS